MKIGIFGAIGRVGSLLAGRLVRRHLHVVPLGRDPQKLAALPAQAEARLIEGDNVANLRSAMADVERAVAVVPPSQIGRFIEALPDRTGNSVILGSTRRFSTVPSRRAEFLKRAEAMFLERGIAGTMLHPTMIYGAAGENNVQRIASLIRRFGVVPLPSGGRSMLQPIHVDDLVACLEAAIFRTTARARVITVAGPEPVSWAAFVRAIAAACGRRVRILNVPLAILHGGAAITRLIPGVPSISNAEVRRLVEDKAFSIDRMNADLGVRPRSLEDGLATMFSRTTASSLVLVN